MRLSKGLLTLAVLALVALMGFASTATAAEDGTVVHVEDLTPIPANRELHLVGWTRFSAGALASYQCHVTSVLKTVDDTTGWVTNFSIPDTSKCSGTGFMTGCKLESHKATTTNSSNEETWHFTVTPPTEATPAGDLDLTAWEDENLIIHNKFKNEGSFCAVRGTEVTWTLPSITLKPLGTNNKHAATNTLGNLGETAAAEEGIAGFEIEASGTLNTAGGGSDNVTTSGELELTEDDRCTWMII